jgi:hypothetical protein
VYIVLFGKLLLHSMELGAVGTVNTGDSLGEEGIYEKSDGNFTTLRKEIATAEEDSYVLELSA